jgi:hypothetical protein
MHVCYLLLDANEKGRAPCIRSEGQSRHAKQHGCDFLHTGQDGLIDEFTVMVRPRSAALALAEAMNAELLAVQRALDMQAPA